MADRSLHIRLIAGALGAEISGVDLSENLDDGTIAAIRRAWLDHLVIFFHHQELPPERFLAFAPRFGEVVEYPFLKGLDGFPEITPVVKLEHERVNFGGLWHSDTAYLEHPAMGTMLIAREVPPFAATPCSPICISPTRRHPRACRGCSTGSSRSTPRPRPK